MPSGRHCGDGSHYLLVNDFVIFRVVVENDLIRKPNKGERLINAPRLGEVRFAWHDARSPRRKVAHSSEEPPP